MSPSSPRSTKATEGDRQRHEAMRQRRIAAGLCQDCKNPVESGKLHCESHLARFRINQKQYLKENPGARKKRAEYRALYNERFSEKRNAYMRKYTQEHKEHIAAYKRTIRAEENARKRSPEYKAKRNELRRLKKLENPGWDMADRLRKRIGRAIRDRAGIGAKKAHKTAEYIGCSVPDLLTHIESLFRPGMTWANRSEWHIDHIRPCAAFDLTDPAQQRACFHYTNLQPLWKADNLRKHAKVLVA